MTAFWPPRSSSSLIAKLGFEIEISAVRVEPFFPKGTVLIRGRGWRLETDWFPNTQRADLEFVFSPMDCMEEIERVADEILGLVDSIRNKALSHPERKVDLAEVSDDFLCPCTLTLSRSHFSGRLQPTYGIGLKNMAKSVDLHFQKKIAESVHKATGKVSKFHFERYAFPLSEAALGLIELINLYLQRARGVLRNFRAPKINFKMMIRSDFCSVFDKLLSVTEQTQVRKMLLVQPGDDMPGLMQALSMAPDALVFKNSYFDQTFKKVAGPTVANWLASIVFGRSDGEFKKDLLSPPPGFKLHSGDLDKDFGMGAMGVDEINQLMLFEIRSGVNFPKDISMNAQMKYAIFREFGNARIFNSALVPFDDASFVGASSFAILEECDKACRVLAVLAQGVKKYANEMIADDWMEAKRVATRLQSALFTCLESVAAAGPADSIRGLMSTLLGMRSMLMQWTSLPEVPDNAEQIALLLRRCDEAVALFVDELWETARRLDS